MRARQIDCLIIGGGPAGAMLAWELARDGKSVVLVDHGRAHYSGPYETVLGTTRSQWERMGLVAELGAGVQVDPLRHGAIWGSDELVWREDGDVGLMLQRGTFDRAFRDAAARAGARVVVGARAERKGDDWQVGEAAYAPRFVAYATGRGSVDGLPKMQSTGPLTTAVTVLGEPAGGDRMSAVVEAVGDGWIWTHVPAQGPASAAVLLDRDRLKGAAVDDVLGDVLGRSLGPAGRLRDWRVAHANDATMGDRGICRDVLVLGDAAATIDPLASQGVEKAVSAATHAACVLATALERPEWWPRLCALHSQWELGLQAAHRRSAYEFYDSEDRFGDQPFWRRRMAPSDPTDVASDMTLRVADGVRAARVLMRHGPRYVEVDGAIDRDSDAEVARVGRVPVATLVRLFATPRTVADAVAHAKAEPSLFVLTPHEVHGAIVQLAARGWLVGV